MSADSKRTSRLFWRIFLSNVLLIVMLAVTSLVAFVLFGGGPKWHRGVDRMASLIAATIKPGAGDQPDLKAKLDEIRYISEADLAVYTVNGRLLAAAGDDTPSPLHKRQIEKLSRTNKLSHGEGMDFAILLPGKAPRTYLVVRWHDAGDHARFMGGLILALVVVALMSIPLSRAIARPMERLTLTARKLGDGDLSAKTGIDRKDEIGVLAHTMDEMAGRLKKRIESEKELLANVSHELRTPLSRIGVALELSAEDEVSEDEVKKNLEGIAGDVAELQRLIDDVLTVARLDLTEDDAGQRGPVLRRQEIEPRDLISDSHERFTRLHPTRKIDVELESVLPGMNLDPILVRRVLDNLLDNAAKYSPEESRIELKAMKTDAGIAVEVSDRGIGVSEEDLGRIFEPFFRAEHSRSRKAGGTGLGLTLCKRIVEAHGGTIEAIRRQAGGTTFRIALPALLSY